MISQGKYIAYAFLMLGAAIVFFLFFSKIPAQTFVVQNEPQAFCGTKDPSTQILTKSAIDGKRIFQQKCAACHSIYKDLTGPALNGFVDRGTWRNKENIYKWIHNPSSFMAKDKYTQELKKRYGSMMTAFPDLSKEDIDAVMDYIGAY